MEKNKRLHVLVFPFPAQGHINPMLQFAKRLVSKGLKATLVSTQFMMNSSHLTQSTVGFEPISDGYDNSDFNTVENFDTYVNSFKTVGSRTLSELIDKQSNMGYPVSCLIYDSFLPWALEVARKHGIRAASFFTQSCTVNGVYYHAFHGNLRVPLIDPIISLNGLPVLEAHEVPSFVSTPDGSYASIFQFVLQQFSNLGEVDWVLCNTIAEIENEVVNWMKALWPVKTIGPTLPSMYLDKRVQEDTNYVLNLWKPTSEACIDWLNSKPKGSVVYISFGSIASLDSSQMDEIAYWLKETEISFLWVVRKSEIDKLPERFMEETEEKGLIVSWCVQLEVLAHPAIGCFLTHCGWNSVLEGLSLGVAMVAMPHWSDQPTNAKYLEDMWRVGVKVKKDEKMGIVRREEIELCVKEIMEGEKGKESRINAIKWRDTIRKAMDEGGSSDKNIDEFIDELVRKKIEF